MKLLTFAFLTFIGLNAIGATKCSDAVVDRGFYSIDGLQAPVTRQESTKSLIGYLSTLVENGFLKTNHLERLQASLAAGLFANPLMGNESKLSKELEVHWLGLQRYMNRNLDTNLLAEWVDKALSELKINRDSRSTVKEETSSLYREIELVTVAKGKLWSAYDSDILALARKKELSGQNPLDIEKEIGFSLPAYFEIMQDFEVTSTVITQGQWLKVMGALPSKVVLSDEDSHLESPAGVIYEPNYPVTWVSVFSMMVFANKLSELHGLEPTYILDMKNFKGSASEGTLVVDNAMISSNSVVININTDNEDYYSAPGYRLPTGFEREYIGRINQREHHAYHFGSDEKNLSDYAWFGKDQKVMEVALKKPLRVPGGLIYDYHGNVAEVVYGWFGYHDEARKNPQPAIEGQKTHIDKGFYYYGQMGAFGTVGDQEVSSNSSLDRVDSISGIGFRLVRSLPEGSLK